MRCVRAAAEEIGRTGRDYAVVVNKSTVPIGSGKWVRMVIQAAYFERYGRDADALIGVVSNPGLARAPRRSTHVVSRPHCQVLYQFQIAPAGYMFF